MGWICFYPASAFMGKASMLTLPHGMAFVTLALGIALFAVACAVFRAGFKQYESAGS